MPAAHTQSSAPYLGLSSHYTFRRGNNRGREGKEKKRKRESGCVDSVDFQAAEKMLSKKF